MDDLLRSLKSLHINGTEQEERLFDYWKKELLEQLSEEERQLLRRLRKHHEPTLRHQVMVAHDVAYIARELGLDEQALTVAALLHDVGKLDVHVDLLNLSEREQEELATRHNVRGNPLKAVTTRQLITYKAERAADPGGYEESFLTWLRHHGQEHLLDEPAFALLKTHQQGARRYLRAAGVPWRVIELVASHHPSYLDDEELRRMPRHARIIELADKFNALVQSEGVRHYFSRKSRATALAIIIHELKEDAGRFERKALATLAARHLPAALEEELIPNVERIEHRLREALAKGQRPEGEEATRLAGELTAILALSDELHGALSGRLIHTLEGLRSRLLALEPTVLDAMRVA